MSSKSKEQQHIKLTERQARHLERVMQNRALAEAALSRTKEEEANTIDLICDAHNVPLVNGIRYENGFLIIPPDA